ncbi:MAG: hypothetical protein KAH44_27500, partial [Oricola sp.]|nr:hypothetical protein [Oricola sp.]
IVHANQFDLMRSKIRLLRGAGPGYFREAVLSLPGGGRPGMGSVRRTKIRESHARVCSAQFRPAARTLRYFATEHSHFLLLPHRTAINLPAAPIDKGLPNGQTDQMVEIR